MMVTVWLAKVLWMRKVEVERLLCWYSINRDMNRKSFKKRREEDGVKRECQCENVVS